MIVRITKENFNESLIKYKKFIWFIYIDDQEDEKYILTLKPSWADHKNEIIFELNNTFEDIVIGESKISEVLDIIHGFNIEYKDIWDGHNKHYKPFYINIDKGWIKNTSLGLCYCLDTIMEMIHDLYPEFFQEQKKEG